MLGNDIYPALMFDLPALRGSLACPQRGLAPVLAATLGAAPVTTQAAQIDDALAPGECCLEDATLSAKSFADQALAFDAQGLYLEAAAQWEKSAACEVDIEAQVIARLHAVDALHLAFEKSEDPADHCAAEGILLRILEEDSLEYRARADFTKMLEQSRAAAIDCSILDESDAASASRKHRVSLLFDKPGQVPVDTRPTDLRMPPANASTVFGSLSLALAVPVLGGLLYAVIDDSKITRTLDADTAAIEAGNSPSEAEMLAAKQLGDRGIRNRNLEIGLGISSAALTGLGVGLLIRGRRKMVRMSDTQISVLPHASPRGAGVALRGRF